MFTVGKQEGKRPLLFILWEKQAAAAAGVGWGRGLCSEITLENRISDGSKLWSCHLTYACVTEHLEGSAFKCSSSKWDRIKSNSLGKELTEWKTAAMPQPSTHSTQPEKEEFLKSTGGCAMPGIISFLVPWGSVLGELFRCYNGSRFKWGVLCVVWGFLNFWVLKWSGLLGLPSGNNLLGRSSLSCNYSWGQLEVRNPTAGDVVSHYSCRQGSLQELRGKSHQALAASYKARL